MDEASSSATVGDETQQQQQHQQACSNDDMEDTTCRSTDDNDNGGVDAASRNRQRAHHDTPSLESQSLNNSKEMTLQSRKKQKQQQQKQISSTRLRLVDGSKSCQQLLQDHLEEVWCASGFNLRFDEEGNISGYLGADFLIQFTFLDEERFVMETCVYHSGFDHQVPRASLSSLLETAQKMVRDCYPNGELKVMYESEPKTSCIIIMMEQVVSSASLLIDEEFEGLFDTFLSSCKSIRKLFLEKGIRSRHGGIWSFFGAKKRSLPDDSSNSNARTDVAQSR